MQSSLDLFPGLVIVPPYRDGELIQSHLRRIADANYITHRQLDKMLARLVPEPSKAMRQKFAELLTERFGYPPGLVQSLVQGGCLYLNSGRGSSRQVCPECLSQEATQSVLLAEPAYAICPTHALAHLVKCPECHSGLLWGKGRGYSCACGFDLRDSERVKVSPDTQELFLACLENRPLGDLQATLSVDTPDDRMKRLDGALEYLSTICAMQEGQTMVVQNPVISKTAHQWESIGLIVKANSKQLRDVVTEIEMQLVYTKTIPGRGVLQPEKIRKAICWGHLRDVAQSAHQSVIKLEETNDIGCIAEMHGLDPQDVLATQLMVNKCISVDFRAEMRSQFNGLKRQRGANPELEGRKVAALISLVQELRSVHELSWLKRLQSDNKMNLFAFIAVGALQPWAAAPFKNWHVLLSDVERLSRLLLGQPFPKMQRGEMGDPYVVKFSQIFSERSAPSDWLGLSSRELGNRVEKLVRASEYPISSDDMQDLLALPLGFCAFLVDGRITVCGDPQEGAGLEKLALVSESWEVAAQELARVCLRAQATFARLNDWQRVAANVAWSYSCGIRDGGSAVEAWKRAKAELAEAEAFSHKAIRAAIERYETPSVAQSC